MKTLFKNRQLSRHQASIIAYSQYDLGETSKLDMRVALAGIIPCQALINKDSKKEAQRIIDGRIKAFDQLGPLSKIIVLTFLENDSIEDAKDNFDYIINNLKKAKTSVK